MDVYEMAEFLQLLTQAQVAVLDAVRAKDDPYLDLHIAREALKDAIEKIDEAMK